MYIKVFNENLACSEGTFEVGKTYSINKELLSINNGFSYYKKLNDISTFTPKSRYCLVQPKGKVLSLEKTLFSSKKYITDKIKIIKELSLNELIELDLCGEWIYNYLLHNYKRILKNKLLYFINKIIEKDSIGYYCYLIAKNIPNIDTKQMENLVIQKDDLGMICYDFMNNIKNCDVNKLQNAILKKDKTGQYSAYLCDINLKGLNICSIIKNVLKKDKIGEWSFYCFVRCNCLSEKDRVNLINHIFKVDTNGKFKKSLNYILDNNIIEIDKNLLKINKEKG